MSAGIAFHPVLKTISSAALQWFLDTYAHQHPRSMCVASVSRLYTAQAASSYIQMCPECNALVQVLVADRVGLLPGDNVYRTASDCCVGAGCRARNRTAHRYGWTVLQGYQPRNQGYQYINMLPAHNHTTRGIGVSTMCNALIGTIKPSEQFACIAILSCWLHVVALRLGLIAKPKGSMFNTYTTPAQQVLVPFPL